MTELEEVMVKILEEILAESDGGWYNESPLAARARDAIAVAKGEKGYLTVEEET